MQLNLSSNLIIPEGTQVVTKVYKQALNSQAYKKVGSVGVVTQLPFDNSQPYLITFPDGIVLPFMQHEFTIRRREVPTDLVKKDEDLTQYIIYRCQVGSHAFGLSTDDSDDDIRGIYLLPAELHWSLFKIPEQIEHHQDGRDEVYWELEKYLLLALKANPNILEALWTPLVHYMTPLAEELRSMRTAFLSKYLFKTYSGYVISQFRKMTKALETRGKYKPKHAMHLIRLLLSGIHALKEGDIKVDVSEYRSELLQIKNGEWRFADVKQWALDLEREFNTAWSESHLPEKPDYDSVNRFLIKARRSMVDERITNYESRITN